MERGIISPPSFSIVNVSSDGNRSTQAEMSVHKPTATNSDRVSLKSKTEMSKQATS